jgi:hypothetical protein
MPVIYSAETKDKGFIPCSYTYKTMIQRAMGAKKFRLVHDLFQQAHKLVWKFKPEDGQYHHQLMKDIILTPEQYNRISSLTGEQITLDDLNTQCGVGLNKARISAFLGPQVPVVNKANREMTKVQKASYEQAQNDGFPVNDYRGIGLYAPSPFQQTLDDANHEYRPENEAQESKKSAGVCDNQNECDPGLECVRGRCVVPVNQRMCPPFQYPVELKDSNGVPFTVRNPSSNRTEKTRKFSAFWNKWYETCVPDQNHSTQRWIDNPQLRRYIGLVFDVEQIPVDDWIRQVNERDHPILQDPLTGAPYFIRMTPEDDENRVKRVYKLNSAYSPSIVGGVVTMDETGGAPQDDDDEKEPVAPVLPVLSELEAPEDLDVPDSGRSLEELEKVIAEEE